MLNGKVVYNNADWNVSSPDHVAHGNSSRQAIANAITKGQRPDGRILAPIMPWHAFAKLTAEDVGAIVIQQQTDDNEFAQDPTMTALPFVAGNALLGAGFGGL